MTAHQPVRTAATALVLLAGFVAGCGDEPGSATGKQAASSSQPAAGTSGSSAARVARQPARLLTGHTDGVHAVTFSPDGRRILTASHDGTARLWDAATGKALHVLEGHGNPVYGAAFSDDGERIATCGSDGRIFVWDADSGELLAILEGLEAVVHAVVFAPDGSVISGGRDGMIRRWDVRSEQQIWGASADPLSVACLAVSPDGTLMASSGGSCSLVVWDLTSGRPLWREPVPANDEEEQRLHERQGAAAAGRADGPGAAAGRSYSAGVVNLAFSPDGARLYSQRFYGAVHEWDARTGRHVRHLEPFSPAMAIDVSPDGRWAAVASEDGTHVWDASGNPMRLVANLGTDDDTRVHDIAFSPDGRTAALARGGYWELNGVWYSSGNTAVPIWDLSALVTASATRPSGAASSRPASVPAAQ